MRTSHYLLSTLRETPADAETISHQLMLRAGLIRKLASGLYSWLPTGLRVLRKIEAIVRQEMNRAGAIELLMPAVQPAELWQESGRWDHFGPELLRMKDRHARDFCLGPTHEEVITDLMRRELNSYKQLPRNFYQIQMKFRDEIRPRFGVMRAREFIMKDAYSFHLSSDCLEKAYQSMHEAYTRIFTRIGLEFRAVLANTGSIGGSLSHEFHVLADTGEDAIVFSDHSPYAANLEIATALLPKNPRAAALQALTKVATPKMRTIDEVSSFLKTPPEKSVKTLIVEAESGVHDANLVALILRGDHELNVIKAEKHPWIKAPLQFATTEAIVAAIGCEPGSIGPVQLPIPIIIDHEAAHISDFVCGANENDQHYTGVNWQRDAACEEVYDLRNVIPGDLSPDGQGALSIKRGIEVGHIFQLGTKYSEALQAKVLDETGQERTLIMGCYGIGVSRIAAAAIEQNHDDRGIIWPTAIAPFQVAIIPINRDRASEVAAKAEWLYQSLINQGIDVLMDDRSERPGVMFADMELLGIPHHIIISERNLAQGQIEYKERRHLKNELVPVEEILDFIQTKCCHDFD